jgi:hypothetical protein
MAFRMRLGTKPTVGSTAVKVSKPLPLHLQQPKRPRRPWDSTSAQSTSKLDGTAASQYLNATAPPGCRVVRLSLTEWRFDGPWQAVQAYNLMVDYYRDSNFRMSRDTIRDAAVFIGDYLQDNPSCTYRMPRPVPAPEIARRAR